MSRPAPRPFLRPLIAVILAVVLTGGFITVNRLGDRGDRIYVTAYFSTTNGVFAGDEVRIMGVPVGRIERITPGPRHVEVLFWYRDRYQVPADVNALVLSPTLVTARVIQLSPAYTGGPTMTDHGVIPPERTAVPVEWDDLRDQLAKLTTTLQPDQPGGVAPLGQLINTAADNVRGHGATIRDTLVKLAQTMSILGDHSTDAFTTIRHLSTLTDALKSSTDALAPLNHNLATVTGMLANGEEEIATAVRDFSAAVTDVQGFVADNRDAVGMSAEKLASISDALVASLPDLKQTLHVTPTSLSNFINIYQPAQSSLTGVMLFNNFNNPVSFICGAIEAASRLGAEQSAKLCTQYLAPIIKNRQYNFPPFGFNPIVGAQARPNEITYSEDWLRPGHIPPAAEPAESAPSPPIPGAPPPLPAEATALDPAGGLPAMMLPPSAAPTRPAAAEPGR